MLRALVLLHQMHSFEEQMAAAGVDLKTQCVFVEILVAVDEAGSEDAGWAAVQETLDRFNSYFDVADRPAGIIYPVRDFTLSGCALFKATSAACLAVLCCCGITEYLFHRCRSRAFQIWTAL